ncbi:Uu.00g116400.m01.CDS01 [Anthostomella pinea]|uniref:Uu.00g116400.m01.CDS01 n=1 Tax=Anthostomella pinea TaxID=933095 RepID=A0AAI8YGU9_9PEZI|nr:Uu.00g116400.m01.CDS01 [Anthostomella pinea]
MAFTPQRTHPESKPSAKGGTEPKSLTEVQGTESCGIDCTAEDSLTIVENLEVARDSMGDTIAKIAKVVGF